MNLNLIEGKYFSYMLCVNGCTHGNHACVSSLPHKFRYTDQRLIVTFAHYRLSNKS